MCALTLERYCLCGPIQCQSFGSGSRVSWLDREVQSDILPPPLNMHPPRPAIEVERRTPKPRQRKRAVKEPAVERQPNRNLTNQPVLAWLTRLAFCSLFWSAATQGENLKTESRTPFLHDIPVRDAEGQVIALPAPFDEQGKPQEARANPVSTAQTCGRCHEYEAIGN